MVNHILSTKNAKPIDFGTILKLLNGKYVCDLQIGQILAIFL